MSFTLAQPAEFERVIQKSRFLVRAWPIDSSEQAQMHIRDCERDAASHHCWAWRLGEVYRFHDAAEPASSAGRPILQAIDSQGLDRVLVVVTRWFGGIKLGVGGLVRAYGGSAAECLRLAPRLQLIATVDLDLQLPFACESSLRTVLADCAGSLLDERYGANGVILRIRLPASELDAFSARLRDLSRGQARVIVTQ